MYQPKIREDLIPRLYRLAKAHGMPMTRLLSQLLESALERLEQQTEEVRDPPAEAYQPTAKPQAEGGDE